MTSSPRPRPARKRCAPENKRSPFQPQTRRPAKGGGFLHPRRDVLTSPVPHVYIVAARVDDHVTEDSSNYFNPESFSDPETRELAKILRRLERAMPSGSCVNWEETRQWNIDVLQELSEEDGKSEALIDRINGAEYEEGGDEHVLFRVDEQPGRIYKSTYGDNFGCCSKLDSIDPELTGKNFNATGNPDIRYYLRRWILLNSLGGYKTRFEAILPAENPKWVPRICISQPWLDGSNPSARMISRSMVETGFLEISQGAFYLPGPRLLLTDAAPRNIRIYEGAAIPFDAIAEIASEEVVRWVERKYGV